MEFLVRKEQLSLHLGEEMLRIGHVSDIHTKWSGKKLEYLRRLLDQNKPDLICFTGDYYDTTKGLELFFDFLHGLCDQFTCILISGNHEGWFRLRETYIQELSQIPNAINLNYSDYSFTSKQGFGYRFTSKSKSVDRNTQQDSKAILLRHNPEHIHKSSVSEFDLILAGHLHGGQFVLRHLSDGRLFPGCLLYKYCVDRTMIDGTTLIVSRGIGDTIPLRFNCPYELVLIDIA